MVRHTKKNKKGGAQMMALLGLPPMARAATPYNHGNNEYPADREFVGQGTTKLVWELPSDPNYVYINSTPEQMMRNLKQNMKEDYTFALKLYRLGGNAYFPNVVRAWTTPNKFIYKKQKCVQLDSRTITRPILLGIIRAAISLMDTHSLFTFDLKGDNMAILRGNFVFIDFGPECSYKLHDACPYKDRYKAFSILILLLHCLNFNTIIPPAEIQELALTYIDWRYVHEFHLFGMGYDIMADPNIDIEFNRSVAPSFIPAKIIEPYRFVETYSSGNPLASLAFLFARHMPPNGEEL
jgi:hypothetical protein